MDTLTAIFAAAWHASLFCANYLTSLFAASPAGTTIVLLLLAFTLAGVFFYGDEAAPKRSEKLA